MTEDTIDIAFWMSLVSALFSTIAFAFALADVISK